MRGSACRPALPIVTWGAVAAVLAPGVHAQEAARSPVAELLPAAVHARIGVERSPGAEGETAQVVGEVVSPGGAFARSLLVPGWGHVVSDAPFRGAVYVGAQSGTAWMLAKSLNRRRTARRFRSDELRIVEAELRASGIQEPDSVRFLAEQDERIEAWDELLETRDQQVEDWFSLGLFLVLLGAADAYVAAHLADRPPPLTIEVLPGRAIGTWTVGVHLPVGGRPGR